MLSDMKPDYIFETSWEVCNRVGGIYAVLSTRARIMVQEYGQRVVFLGPDLGEHSDPYFEQDDALVKELGLTQSPARVRTGYWLVPGRPIAVLVDYSHLWERKNELYAWAWERYQVQSHAACGDYDDSCLFGYAVGQVTEQMYYRILAHQHQAQAVFHANEWQTAFGLFYVQANCPRIGTLFTTHATGIGRSIAGNGKPLYDYFGGYHGDQMAQELGMVSKHSVEKQAAHWSDCFTTVSENTARECRQLLERDVDIVTPNAFELDFVPKAAAFTKAQNKARNLLLQLARQYPGAQVAQDALLVGISGRYEWKNKGIDLFIDAMNALADRLREETSRPVIAYVMIPYLDMRSYTNGNVTVIFIPHYLPIHQASAEWQLLEGWTYYDLLIGLDLSIFPSYYEPWGYTPMESIAFHVPTITTSLSGYGAWVSAIKQARNKTKLDVFPPVTVLKRNDSNYEEVKQSICDCVMDYRNRDYSSRAATRQAATLLSKKTTWESFFDAYQRAYEIALTTSLSRVVTSASNEQ